MGKTGGAVLRLESAGEKCLQGLLQETQFIRNEIQRYGNSGASKHRRRNKLGWVGRRHIIRSRHPSLDIEGNCHMLKLPGLAIVALLLSSLLAAAAPPACLPKSVFTKNIEGEWPLVDLGYINDVLTLCAYERAVTPKADKLLGCWTVDSTTGKLGASAVTAIPGRGRRADLDAHGCVNGYCIAPITPTDHRPIFATSTDGAHAAVLTGDLLDIFETSTKTKVAEIGLTKADAPAETNVSNVPWGLLYNGKTLFVIGTDAGPFTGVWVFKENGDRAGQISIDADRLNIFRGGYGILGGDKVAFSDAGLQNMITVSGANGAAQSVKRNVNHSPCTADQFEQWLEGDESETGSCKRALESKYRPYVDMSPVLLPSGDIIATLSGPAQGTIAVLNPTDLTEKRRLKVPRCP
jgi:hypothetical protein